MEIVLTRRGAAPAHTIYLLTPQAESLPSGLSREVRSYLSDQIKLDADIAWIEPGASCSAWIFLKEEETSPAALEKVRMHAAGVFTRLASRKADRVRIENLTGQPEWSLALAEGLRLSAYQFLHYRSDRTRRKHALKQIEIHDSSLRESQVKELSGLCEAVEFARDLVNEPHSHQTATHFARDIRKAGEKVGYTTRILNRRQIEALKMGGLLGVNRGSVEPPTFSIMEYKPAKPRNKRPLVLVGKGVVFDTGGLSLKPTPGSMDEMKCDMSGGAAVAGVIHALARNRVPVHVVGLVPATDNRPGMHALAPQDVLTISDGTTVEVLNTDAEGRLILADALVFARKYKPGLVIDLATLTGAAVRAIGTQASAVMGTADEAVLSALEKSGFETWERMVRFPLWDEYGEEMKSEIADLRNLGGPYAGQITAGKFLQHFTDYPWIHLDIAGPAYSNTPSGYRTRGGSGTGVRLLYHFITRHFIR